MSGEPALSDSELFRRVRGGDRSAFGQLVDRHKDGLVSYLTRMCGEPDRAEDLAQEAFLRLYERGARYSEEGKLRAYLFRIATNLFRSQLRRQQRWQRLRALWWASNGHRSDPSQPSKLLRDELGQRLSAALTRLPPRYRAPLVLSLIEGWTHREIAELLGCREGTVKSRIHRGRRMLRADLEPYRNGGRA